MLVQRRASWAPEERKLLLATAAETPQHSKAPTRVCGVNDNSDKNRRATRMKEGLLESVVVTVK